MPTAIPTTYRGTQFRSRLEASFAQHFDHIHLAWQYEPEAFALTNGQNYLPDFYLPTSKAWAEVKGPHNERIDKVEQFAADLIAESPATTNPGRYETTHPDMPTVFLLTYDPRDRFPNWLVTHGPGQRASGALTWCPFCRTVVAIRRGRPQCPNCNSSDPFPAHRYDDVEQYLREGATTPWWFPATCAWQQQGTLFRHIASTYKRATP